MQVVGGYYDASAGKLPYIPPSPALSSQDQPRNPSDAPRIEPLRPVPRGGGVSWQETWRPQSTDFPLSGG
jgi:hypothetical protein